MLSGLLLSKHAWPCPFASGAMALFEHTQQLKPPLPPTQAVFAKLLLVLGQSSDRKRQAKCGADSDFLFEAHVLKNSQAFLSPSAAVTEAAPGPRTASWEPLVYSVPLGKVNSSGEAVATFSGGYHV